MVEQLTAFLEPRKILLLGYGREGKSSYAFIRRHLPQMHLGIADAESIAAPDGNITLHCGAEYMHSLTDYDLVLKSPGVSLRGIPLPENTEITCQTDLFLRFAPCVCLGVTGTKGKTTTATLLHAMLEAGGISALLLGNMGLPVLDAIEQSQGKIAVLELSSHQLEFMNASPHIGILTNLYPEHLDHYNNGFAGYAAAKMHITRFQKEGDYFLYNAAQDFSSFPEFTGTRAETIAVPQDTSDPFLISLCGRNPHLRGRHFTQNIYFAATAAQLAGTVQAGITRAVEGFAGLAHRMENAGEYRGITFYNDAVTTAPEAVMLTVEALEEVDTLLFGGKDRGIDYTDFIVQLENSSIHNLIALPDTGYAILEGMQKRGTKKNLVKAAGMEEAVAAAYRFTGMGKICLFSPAASSYNVYRNFEEKGNHFKDCVRELGENGFSLLNFEKI